MAGKFVQMCEVDDKIFCRKKNNPSDNMMWKISQQTLISIWTFSSGNSNICVTNDKISYQLRIMSAFREKFFDLDLFSQFK